MKFSIIIAIVIILILGIFLSFFIWQGIYLPRDENGKELLFSVKKGDDFLKIAENLEKEGLIKNRFFFNFYIFLKRKADNLQAGKYFLSPSLTISEIAQKIISGDIATMTITIPEGWTKSQIEKKLNLKLPGENLEGFLFPDTYQFPIDVSGKEVVDKMKDNFNKKISATLKEEIERQGKTIPEIITMASLIEKEVKNFKDKKLVSGILWKRMAHNMPLQVDATITYITGKKTTKISIQETRIESPYNTYKYRGLPPTPICNPGLESILAAVYPESSDYWYYLSAPTGETIFSKTLQEHNYAKAKYLK